METEEIKLEGYVLTHEGKVRSNNEDNYSLFGKIKEDTTQNQAQSYDHVQGEMFAAGIYDGVGGEEDGEVASLIAAKSIQACPLENVLSEAMKQLQEANRKICELNQRNGLFMGSTAAQIYFSKGSAICVNLGDSRGYFFRDGRLLLLSKDHSEGQRMIDMGIVTQEEARKSRNWHVLTQYLGIDPKEFLIEPYFSDEIILKKDDLFLLASDGLTDMMPDEELRKVLHVSSRKDLKSISEELFTGAMQNGGKDNITIMMVRVL
ncbi:MAG: serine/threonine-protein phosphatase [Lachnospiraceae bacterium]|nr:serine/threonine-protein phosphatase [Lachnospiraceae bacterium]